MASLEVLVLFLSKYYELKFCHNMTWVFLWILIAREKTWALVKQWLRHSGEILCMRWTTDKYCWMWKPKNVNLLHINSQWSCRFKAVLIEVSFLDLLGVFLPTLLCGGAPLSCSCIKLSLFIVIWKRIDIMFIEPMMWKPLIQGSSIHTTPRYYLWFTNSFVYFGLILNSGR